jgi:hypothetical protein
MERGFTLDNPIWQAIGNTVEGFTNVPLGRMSNKMLNLDNAMDPSNDWWQRVALVLGWNTWDLGIRDKDIEEIKSEIKISKEVEKKIKDIKKRKEKKIEKEIVQAQEDKIKEEENKELQKKEKEEGKEVLCAAISKKGKRCKTKVVSGKSYCTIHEKVEQTEGGKKSQCKKMKQVTKKRTERCKMQTSNKSGYCYYHD